MAAPPRIRYARHELLALQSAPAVRTIPVGRGGNFIPKAHITFAAVSSRGRTEKSRNVELLPADVRGQLAIVQASYARIARANGSSGAAIPLAEAQVRDSAPAAALPNASTVTTTTHVAVVKRSKTATIAPRAAPAAAAGDATSLHDDAPRGAALLPAGAIFVHDSTSAEGDDATLFLQLAQQQRSRTRSGDRGGRRSSSKPQVLMTPAIYNRVVGLPPANQLNPSARTWQPAAQHPNPAAPSPSTDMPPLLRAPLALGADFVLPPQIVRPRRIVEPVVPDVFVFNALRSTSTASAAALYAPPPPSMAATLLATAARTGGRGRSAARTQSPALEDLGTGRRRLEAISAIESFVISLPAGSSAAAGAAPRTSSRASSKGGRSSSARGRRGAPGKKEEPAAAAAAIAAPTTGARAVVGAAPVEKKKRRR